MFKYLSLRWSNSKSRLQDASLSTRDEITCPRDWHVEEINSPLSFSHLATDDGAHLGQDLGCRSDEEGETETCVLHVVYFFSNLYCTISFNSAVTRHGALQNAEMSLLSRRFFWCAEFIW